MSADSLQALLERLCTGDEEAAERVFREYEPYLRLVVRRMLPARLRAKFDSIDVVQSVWGDLLEGFRDAGWCFKDAAHLRAFLVKATRNRFLDRLRQHQAALDRERSIEEGHLREQVLAEDPRPSEVAEADELWQEMLALCPPQHRELLRLKREGRSLADIAAHSGLHPSSVRRIFYDLARQLALKREARSPEQA
jgi:RNA polymerase sigma-70 factor (ECF subfamily)